MGLLICHNVMIVGSVVVGFCLGMLMCIGREKATRREWQRQGENHAIRALVRHMMRHSAGKYTEDKLFGVYRDLVDAEDAKDKEADHA